MLPITSPPIRSAATFVRLCAFAAICAGNAFLLAPSPAAANVANACAMLSPGDLHRFLGKNWVVTSNKATPPEKSHCTWGPPGGDGRLTVQILAADQYVPGDANLAGIGEKAALDLVPLPFGGAGGIWRGRAVKGENAVNFYTSSKGVSRKAALAVLTQLVARM